MAKMPEIPENYREIFKYRFNVIFDTYKLIESGFRELEPDKTWTSEQLADMFKETIDLLEKVKEDLADD